MRTITYEEIQESMDHLEAMSEAEAQAFATEMGEEQPFITVYCAAIADRGDFEDDEDEQTFFGLVTVVLHAMLAAGGGLQKVTPGQIDRYEAQTMKVMEQAAEDQDDNDLTARAERWLVDYNQRPLLEFILDSLFSPESPYDVSSEGSGLIFTYLRIIIDCLDSAKVKKAKRPKNPKVM